MPYYNSFCSFCSVRLGSIVVGILSFVNHAIFKPFSILISAIFQVQDIAPAFIMISMGPSWFGSFAKSAEDYIKDNGLDDRYLPDIRMIDKSSLPKIFKTFVPKLFQPFHSNSDKDTHFITFATLHVFYLLACILEVIGAFIVSCVLHTFLSEKNFIYPSICLG